MNISCGGSYHQKLEQATRGLHPLRKLNLEQADLGDKSRIAKFLQRQWRQLSAFAWQGYLELGRGAVFITVDNFVLAGWWNASFEYADERECFTREVMSGYQPMGKMMTAVNTYDPNREIVAVLKWRGQEGYLYTILSDASTTPRQNFADSDLEADPNRFPRSRKVTEESAAKNATTHPLSRLASEHWKLWAAVAWKGYLHLGRGAVLVLLGKDYKLHLKRMKSSFVATPFTQEIPAGYFALDNTEIISLLKASNSVEIEEFLNTMANYDPQKTVCLFFEWEGDHTHHVPLVMSNEELSPTLCYEHLAHRLNELN